MNYYEELGIDRDATISEIREAYKLAARLLHPDLQQDQRLKELAEREMRRLGGVVAVLTDPRERARYDAGLGDGACLMPPVMLARAGRPEFLQTVVRHWFWILLGSTTVGMGTWYAFARSTAVPGARPAAESARTAAGPPARAIGPVPERRRPVKATENAGARNVGQETPLRARVMETTKPSLSAPAPVPAEIPDEGARVEPGIVAPQQKARVAEVVHDGDESPFTGEWLYAADGQREERTGSYPARYVEFRLRTESGTLMGDYRALHTLVDKAISPEVVLHVRGESPRRNTGTLDWESSNGARGQLELTLRSPNQLQVKWWTTQFGKQEALTSGMAVLIRLRTP
jgi:curved DNA-binding protein CbpA